VVSHGSASAVQALLVSLARYERADRLQIILTDNLGADLPDLGASKWHSLIMIRNDRPQGYARNHNAAFQQAQGEYFCVVNPDVLFVESVLQVLAQTMATRAADIIAPLIVDSRGRIQDSFRRLPDPIELVWRRTLRSRGGLPAPATDTVSPDWIAGIFLLMRRETFGKLGGFDARYHLYFEDVDLCTRARLMGFSVMLNSRVRVQHDARRASRQQGRYLLWHVQSAFRFFASPVYRAAVLAAAYSGRTGKQ
jgi:hypothetical protein